MQTYVDTKDLTRNIRIGTPYQYVEEVDETLREDMEEQNEAWRCLEDIIAFEIARYLTFHTGGKRPFDQSVSDHFGFLIGERKERFRQLTGKEYDSRNSGW